MSVLEAFAARLQKDSMAERAEERKEKSKKTDCLGAETEKKKTGLMIPLTRKRVLGESEGNWENKKVKTTNEKKAGKSIRLAEEEENAPLPPKVPSGLEKRIKGKGGRDIQLLIKKKITNTYLSKPHGRLLIPMKQMRKDACFLIEKEEAILILSSEEKGSNEVAVMVTEPCGVDSGMILVKWNMQKSKNYGLRIDWGKAIERNHEEAKHLAVHQFMQHWSFRVGPQLWFALTLKYPLLLLLHHHHHQILTVWSNWKANQLEKID